MRCAWRAYINLLPHWLRSDVDRLGREGLLELRLRINAPPELITSKGTIYLGQAITASDVQLVINAASQYSPWAAETASKGYITAPGGHRIGICGEAVIKNGIMTAIRTPTSLCLRVAKDFPGIADKYNDFGKSVLIIGSPGSGKTTLLRDLIRRYSDCGQMCVGVVDERGEVFPRFGDRLIFPAGPRTDIITGCGKTQGIDALLRCMGPHVIAVDEITAESDCVALIHAGWCGVRLLATAHAGSREELYTRPVYKEIVQSMLFDTLIVLHRDKSWSAERIT